MVEGSPELEIQIGPETRVGEFDIGSHWDLGGTDQMRFSYRVVEEDRDDDGISILEGAISLDDGSIRDSLGAEVDLTIGRAAIRNDRDHRVRGDLRGRGEGEPRQCGVERREAARFSPNIVAEWDGSPFRVDIVRNFPAWVTDDDLLELLEPIATLADDIEEQLGYRIVEMGDLIPVPAGATPGFDQDFRRFRDRGGLPRQRGQLLAFYLHDEGRFWDHRGGAPMWAFMYHGATVYTPRTMGAWWTDEDDCCNGRFEANGRHGHTLVHEVFHLLGFKHPDDPFDEGVLMARGSMIRPWLSGSRVHYASAEDIEVLRCVFPR